MGKERYASETRLYMGPWYRRSPYFEATVRAGCQAYDVYNHTLLPGYYRDPNEEYEALLSSVVVWDVGAERTVEVSGPDADRLIDMLTCRDLTKCAVKQGKYMLVTAADGGIVNDPVLLHVAENRWWMQLADSDAGLYALGVATGARPGRGGLNPRRASDAGAGPEGGGDPGEARRSRHLRHQVLLGRVDGDPRDPGADQPHGVHGAAGIRGQLPGFLHRRRSVERGPRGRRGVRRDGGRPEHGAPGRGRDDELRLRHDPREQPVPAHGPGAFGRGAAAGLLRQGGARADSSRGRRPKARGDRVRGRALRHRSRRLLAGSSRRPGDRQGHRSRVVASAQAEHRLRVGAHRRCPIRGTGSTSSPSTGTWSARPRPSPSSTPGRRRRRRRCPSPANSRARSGGPRPRGRSAPHRRPPEGPGPGPASPRAARRSASGRDET